jgi:hypothetical protein
MSFLTKPRFLSVLAPIVLLAAYLFSPTIDSPPVEGVQATTTIEDSYPVCDKETAKKMDKVFVCDQLELLYPYICTSPYPPAQCLCSGGEGKATMKNVVYCPEAEDKTEDKTESEQKMDRRLERPTDQIVKPEGQVVKPDWGKQTESPISVFVKPYNGGSCIVNTKDDQPLVLQMMKKGKKPVNDQNTPTPTSRRGKEEPEAVAKPIRGQKLAICFDDCDDPTRWAITPVDSDDISAGHQICMIKGGKKFCLCWEEEKGLEFAPDPKKDDYCTIFHVGMGEYRDGEVTGYRILAHDNLLYGLTLDKESKEVGVTQIFEEVDKVETKKKGLQISEFQSCTETCHSVWKLDDCEPLPEVKDDAPMGDDKN